MLTGMVSTPAVMPPEMSPLRLDRRIRALPATLSVGIRAAILVEPDRGCPRHSAWRSTSGAFDTRQAGVGEDQGTGTWVEPLGRDCRRTEHPLGRDGAGAAYLLDMARVCSMACHVLFPLRGSLSVNETDTGGETAVRRGPCRGAPRRFPLRLLERPDHSGQCGWHRLQG